MNRSIKILLLIIISLAVSVQFCSKKMTEQEIFTEAEKLSNSGETNKAVIMYEKLIKDYPDTSNVNMKKSVFMVAFLYANDPKVKDLKKAETLYKDFLNKWPNDELVHTVQWELDHLGKDINEIDGLFEGDSTDSK